MPVSAADLSSVLREPAEGELEPVFSGLAERRYALGLETIYEGYLVHYGRPRLLEPEDDDTALVLGDYLYAQGLARIASLGGVDAVGDLAELISLCAQARADGREGDGAAWAATAAGIAVLRRLRDDSVYEELERRGARLESGLAPHGRFERVGAMATLFAEDAERYAALFRHLLEQGVYVAPSQFEAMFVSLAHGDEEIEITVNAVAGFGG